MLEILSITGVIFVLIATGFVTARLGVFSPGDIRALGKFVVNLALPALILRAVSSRPLGEIANPGYLGAALFGSLAVFSLGYLWSRRVMGETATAGTFSAMGMSCANSGFVGYPILLMVLPEVASLALALNMVVENLVMIPLVLVMAERSRGGATDGGKLLRQIVSRLGRNPIVIALLIGLAVAALGVRLPAVIARPIDLFASASAAVSLAVIGGSLATLRPGVPGAAVIAVVLGKLVLHPLAVSLGLVLMAAIGAGVADGQLAAAAVVMAASPVMSIYPILAQTYGEEQNAALTMLLMTVLSFLTISAVLMLVSG